MIDYRALQAAREEEKLSIFVPLTLLALVTPIYFTVAGQVLSPSRILFLGLVPILSIRLLQGAYGKLRVLDYCLFFNIFWMAVAIGVNNPDRLVGFVGSNTLMILGGYLVGRCYIRNLVQFRAFAKLFGILVVMLLPLALVESLNDRLLIPDLIASIPGVSSHVKGFHDPRLGLHRAQVVFSHVIHYGLFVSMAFSFVFIALRGQVTASCRWIWSFLILMASFFALSSGPLLSVILQMGMSLYDWVLRAWKIRWGGLVWGGGGVYIVLELLSNGPFYHMIVSQLTFNSGNAFVRRLLMEYASTQIMQTPLFGVGFNTWETLPIWLRATSTLDNHWLAIGLVYGLPALLAIAGGLLVTIYGITRLNLSGNEELKSARLAWIFTIVSISFTMMTVAIWGELQSTVFLFFAAGVWLFDAQTGNTGPVTEDPAPPPRKTRYSRFEYQGRRPTHTEPRQARNIIRHVGPHGSGLAKTGTRNTKFR